MSADRPSSELPAEPRTVPNATAGAPAPSVPGEAGGLLAPLRIGPRTLPNRIVFGAHLTNFGVDNTFGARHRAYYAARAAGGCGLLVTEALTVHPLDWPYEHVPFGHRDAIVPALAELAGTVRQTGPDCVLLAQLNHWGGQSSGKLLRQSPWAPSATVEVASKRMARAMEPAHIEAVIAGFAAAAERVAAAGLDGVELNAGQHGLLRQFLSPLTNQRQDDWGGPLEQRLRFPLRVVAVVRAALGPGRVLGLKLCGDELAPWGGLTPDDAVAIARALVAAGGLDYLSVQIGGPYSVHMTEAAMPTPQAHAAHLAQAVREGIGGALPVFAEGRIEAPDVARTVLAHGQADAVVMTRALISDPDLPRKAAGEHPEPLRPHIGMTRYFAVQGDWNRPLGDLINPRAGREARLPPSVRTETGGAPVLVIGGGPAGLEAAATLARLGHAVTLREAAPRLGGMAAVLAKTVEARREFGLLVDYYTALLAHLGVAVELGRPVRPDEPGLDAFAALYVATGATPPPPELPGEGVPVLTPRALLADSPTLPPPGAGRVAVVDAEGGFRMANAVEWLLAHGYGVDVITPDFFVGRELVESAEFLWFPRVAPQGLGQHPMLQAEALQGDALVCRERFSQRERRFGPLAFAVTVQAELPDGGFVAALRARHGRVLTVGDARAPRLMGEAILNAHRTVLTE
ncbi:MAG TPA: FAD-dependent oxidoreductase [bacterium]|nr:FAD-dependent oxidoreductase [bacterium]